MQPYKSIYTNMSAINIIQPNTNVIQSNTLRVILPYYCSMGWSFLCRAKLVVSGMWKNSYFIIFYSLRCIARFSILSLHFSAHSFLSLACHIHTYQNINALHYISTIQCSIILVTIWQCKYVCNFSIQQRINIWHTVYSNKITFFTWFFEKYLKSFNTYGMNKEVASSHLSIMIKNYSSQHITFKQNKSNVSSLVYQCR